MQQEVFVATTLRPWGYFLTQENFFCLQLIINREIEDISSSPPGLGGFGEFS